VSEQRKPLLHRLGDAASGLGRGEPRSRRRRLTIQVSVGLLIFGALVFVAASQWDELQERNVSFDPVWLVPAGAILLCFYAWAALGWDLAVRFLGYRLAPSRAQMIWGQSLLARYVPGNLLVIVGRVMLAEREGVPRRTTLASLVYEGGVSFASAASIGTGFFIAHPDLQDEPIRFAALALVPAVLLVLHPRVFGPAANRGLALLGREPLEALIPFSRVIALVGYFAVAWCIIGTGVFFVGRSIYPLDAADLPFVVSAQALGFCASMAALVLPGGIGVRDAAFAWAVKVAVGGSFAVGAAISIGARVILTAAELVYVGIVTALGRRHSRRAESRPATAAPG
jgi:glycosyltransferase 2 family protein